MGTSTVPVDRSMRCARCCVTERSPLDKALTSRRSDGRGLHRLTECRDF